MKAKLLLALILLAISPLAPAASTAVVRCDGCNAWSMKWKASNSLKNGLVWVLNGRNGVVRKYRVFNEVFHDLPYTTLRETVPLTVEKTLERDWRRFIETERAATEEGVIVLPGDFPVRSVAGALLDPAYATTAIEDALHQMDFWDQFFNAANVLTANLLQLDIPVTRIDELFRKILLQFEFPDGSTMDFTMAYSVNALNGKGRAELTLEGNARMADGRPAPGESASSFRNRTFQDHNGSLSEWMELARRAGLVVRGGPLGTTMICEEKDNEIYCRVVLRP